MERCSFKEFTDCYPHESSLAIPPSRVGDSCRWQLMFQSEGVWNLFAWGSCSIFEVSSHHAKCTCGNYCTQSF